MIASGPFGEWHLQALAWTLLSFVWQGAIIGLAAAVLLRIARAPQVRYVVGVAGLAVMLLVPIVTYLSLDPAAGPTRAASAPRSISAQPDGPVIGLILTNDGVRRAAAVRGGGRRNEPLPSSLAETGGGMATVASIDSEEGTPMPAAFLPLVVWLWLAGVSALTIRLFGGWLVACRMARTVFGPADVRLQAIAADVARRLQLSRAVAIADSAAVAVPTVVGWIKPVVLMPVYGLSGLTPAQLEAVLAHELAHVRRHDYLVNLAQSAIETLLFYHPAVWWLSNRVRDEREHCCDDLAVEACGDRVAYVTALAELASLDRSPTPALAATGGPLLSRAARLLGRPAREPQPPAAPFAVMLAGALLVFASGVPTPIAARPAGTGANHVVAGEQDASSPRVDVTRPGEPTSAATSQPPTPPPAPAVPVSPAPADLGDAAVPPEPPSPPAALAPPMPPVPPVPPVPPEDTRSGDVSWSDGFDRFEVSWSGDFTLADDDRDITWIEDGGWLTIAEGLVFRTRVELRELSNGQIERRFHRNGLDRPFEPEGRQWLADAMGRLVRETGVFAAPRVVRLLRTGGVPAVLSAIDALPADAGYARRRYYDELLDRTAHTPELLSQIVERVAREASGDYDRARVLMRVAASHAVSDAHRARIAAVSRAIDSDYEQRRVLVGIMPERLPEPVAQAILAAAEMLGGAFERSTLLAAVADRGGVTARTIESYLALVRDLRSGFEQRRALTALARAHPLEEAIAVQGAMSAAAIESSHERRQALAAWLAGVPLSPALASAVLSSAEGMSSGHERSTVLIDLIQRGGLDAQTADALFRTARSLGAYEHRRVLEAAVARDLSEPLLIALLKNTMSVASDYERATALIRVAEHVDLSPAARSAYLDAADSLRSEHEQSRVLAALVKAERRRVR